MNKTRSISILLLGTTLQDKKILSTAEEKNTVSLIDVSKYCYRHVFSMKIPYFCTSTIFCKIKRRTNNWCVCFIYSYVIFHMFLCVDKIYRMRSLFEQFWRNMFFYFCV